MQRNERTPLSVFISYAHKDEPLRQRLETHLSLLCRQGLISEWHDRQILAGEEWARDIDQHLETASIILLLISPNFLASDYCYDIEMQRAVARHESGEARVIPILLRPCDWHDAPFGQLQCLPRDGKAVTTWRNRDEAFLDIAQGLHRAIEQQISSARPAPPPLSSPTLPAEKPVPSRPTPVEAMPVNVADQPPLQTSLVAPQPKRHVGTILRIIFYFIGALIAGFCFGVALDPGLATSNYSGEGASLWVILIVWILSIPVLIFVLGRHKQVHLSGKQRISFVSIASCVALLAGVIIESTLFNLASNAPMVAISIEFTIGSIYGLSCCVLALW